MRQAHRGAPLGLDLSLCPLHGEARRARPGAEEGARPAAGVPGRRGVEIRPMMSWMLRRAWEEVAAGGGAARIMSPLPSAPRPPGPHALVGSSGRCGRDSPHCRDPWASSRDGLWQGSLSAALRGPWAAGEWQTPYPHPHPPRGGSCVRACVCVLGGGAVSPLSPGTPASSEPGSSGWAPSQLSPRKDGSPLTHPN